MRSFNEAHNFRAFDEQKRNNTKGWPIEVHPEERFANRIEERNEVVPGDHGFINHWETKPSHSQWTREVRYAPESTYKDSRLFRQETQALRPNEASKQTPWGKEALDIGGYGRSTTRIPFGSQLRQTPYGTCNEGWRPDINYATRFEDQRRQDMPRDHNSVPGFLHAGGPYSAKTALYLAASLTEGATRDALLREANTRDKHSKRPGKAREIANLRMWSENPANPDLREVGPKTIMRNVFGLENVQKPTAEIFYTMLALWRYCPSENKLNVLRYFERGAKEAMKYEGKEFVEFFRRILDFPRRGLLSAQDPNFMEVINDTVAVAAGAKVYLPPETYLTLRSTSAQRTKKKLRLDLSRIGLYANPRVRREQTSSAYTVNREYRKQTNTTKRQGTSAIKKSSNTNMSLGREDEPIDGSTSHLDKGPFTDPEVKLAEDSCCFCWNWGHPCKIVTEEGLCRNCMCVYTAIAVHFITMAIECEIMPRIPPDN